MPAVVVGELAVRVHGPFEHEPRGPGPQHVGLVVAVAVLRPRVADELHAPGALVVVRGLGGVADDEDDGVQVLESAPLKRARDADHENSTPKRIRAQNDTDDVIVLD